MLRVLDTSFKFFCCLVRLTSVLRMFSKVFSTSESYRIPNLEAPFFQLANFRARNFNTESSCFQFSGLRFVGNLFKWISVKKVIRPQITGIFFVYFNSKHRWEVDRLFNTLWCTVLVNLQCSVRQKGSEDSILVFTFSRKRGKELIHYHHHHHHNYHHYCYGVVSAAV